MDGFNFVFDFPQKVICERGAVNRLGSLLKEYTFKKIMIVTDKGLVQCGLIEKVEGILREAQVNYTIFDSVEPNPTIETINEGTRLAEKKRADFLVGIGGGSCIDAAKAIGIIITNGGSIEEYAGVDKYKKRPLPTIAIPTTAGTGSESTPATVITNRKTRNKMSIFSRKGLPLVAILDADLLKTEPADLAAATGMDALSHAIESFTSLRASPLSDALASQAIRLIGKYLRLFVANRRNMQAAQAMIIASNLAGIAFSHTYLGNVHALSHPLGGYFNAPHGVLNAILLPHVMKFNLISNPEKFKEIALLLGENVDNLTVIDAANKAIEAVKKLSDDLNIPKSLKQIGVKESEISEIAKIAIKTRNAATNPRITTVKDFEHLCRLAL